MRYYAESSRNVRKPVNISPIITYQLKTIIRKPRLSLNRLVNLLGDIFLFLNQLFKKTMITTILSLSLFRPGFRTVIKNYHHTNSNE